MNPEISLMLGASLATGSFGAIFGLMDGIIKGGLEYRDTGSSQAEHRMLWRTVGCYALVGASLPPLAVGVYKLIQLF